MVDLNDVWIYIYEKGEARYTDLIRAFVDTGKRSKTVLLSYKKQLEVAGKIKKKISDVTGRPVYYVPIDRLNEVKLLMEKQEIKKKIDQIPLGNQDVYSFLGQLAKALEKGLELIEKGEAQDFDIKEYMEALKNEEERKKGKEG